MKMSLKPVIFSALLALSCLAVIADPAPPDESVHEEAVSGIIMDMGSKKPLKDVNITAVLNSRKEKTALTDVNGEYRFIMLKPGTYKLVFEKEGYKKVIRDSIAVKDKTTLRINIEMSGPTGFSERGPSAWYFFDY
jgi:hypothetical protein